MNRIVSIILGILLLFLLVSKASAQLQGTDILNQPTDIAPDFVDFTNTYYLAEELASFDPKTASGILYPESSTCRMVMR